MYSPAVLAVAVALAAPALSVPVNVARDVAAPTSTAVDASGASIFSTIFKAIPTVVNGISSLFGGDNNQKRELEGLFMRELLLAARDAPAPTDDSGASIFSTIFKAAPTIINGISSLFGGDNNQKRELEDLLTRELLVARDDVESGASIFSTILKAAPTIINGISSLFGGGGDNQQQQKRDVEDLVMRELLAARDDVESGASIFSTILKAAPTIINGISSLFGGGDNSQQKRDIEEFVARALVEARSPVLSAGISKIPVSLYHTRDVAAPSTPSSVDQSGASIFSTILKAAPTIINGISSLFGGDNNQKRELEALFTREILAARDAAAAAADQSGASIFSTIFKAIPTVVNGISSLFGGSDNNQKREVETLLMRELLSRAAAAAADDQSGASIFSTIVKAIPTVVNGISSLFGGDNQKRSEVEHLVMRELLARAAEADESGASIFSTIFKAIPTVVNGISSLFGGDSQQQKREIAAVFVRSFLDDAPVARSLNELD